MSAPHREGKGNSRESHPWPLGPGSVGTFPPLCTQMEQSVFLAGRLGIPGSPEPPLGLAATTALGGKQTQGPLGWEAGRSCHRATTTTQGEPRALPASFLPLLEATGQ